MKNDTLVYPFICASGFHCELTLPREGLTRADADRLKDYIDALVVGVSPTTLLRAAEAYDAVLERYPEGSYPEEALEAALTATEGGDGGND